MRFSQYYLLIVLISFISSLTRAQDSLKICAIRVEFQTDDNPLTTGDGRFVFDTSTVTPYTVDPPPHDRKYFLDQINAVSNYFEVASNKKLHVHGGVFPLANFQSYLLSHDMHSY